MFRCALCGVNTTSVSSLFCRIAKIRVKDFCKTFVISCTTSSHVETSLQQHFSGRSHLMMMGKMRTAEKSVYIKGFQSGITGEELKLFLEQEIGGVNQVWLDADGKYAIAEFMKISDALIALKKTQLQMRGKNLVFKPRLLNTKNAAQPKNEPHLLIKAEYNLDGAKILQKASLEDQLARLCELNRISLSALKDQLLISFELLQVLRKSFPHCLVVPFGSAISGLGTSHSDCDLCLLTEPPLSVSSLVSGKNYFSPALLSVIEELESTYGIPMCPPPPSTPSIHTLVGDDFSGQNARGKGRLHPAFKLLRTHLYNIDTYSRVYSIPRARCPIIRFVHKPTSFDCDICVNNILGPFNTRLVKAYCEFDSRVPELITAVKIWTRSKGIQRTLLNSYALSLMVIYSLQRCSPPVLPCLQDPGAWPRNMQWCGETVENEVDQQITVPWNTSFTTPGSLLPSTNTESIVSLLLHFFKFYAEKFDFKEHVLTVRNLTETMTRESVTAEALEVVGEGRRPLNLQQPFVIQDPFDLFHNMTRVLNEKTFMHLLDNLEQTGKLLEMELEKKSEPVSILNIFTNETAINIPLQFSMESVANLLQCEKLQPLLQHLSELELANHAVRDCLGHIVLKKLVGVLASKFNFYCVRSEENYHVKERVGVVTDYSEVEWEEFTSGGGKLKRLNNVDFSVNTKRIKDQATTALGLLHDLLSSEPHPCSYVCSAYSNTWLNTKRTSRELSEGVAPIHQSGNLTTTLPFEPGSSRNSFEECAPQAPNQYSSVSGAKGDLYPKLVEPVDLPPSIPLLQFQLTPHPPSASKTESDDPGSGGSNVCVIDIKVLVGETEDVYSFLSVLNVHISKS